MGSALPESVEEMQTPECGTKGPLDMGSPLPYSVLVPSLLLPTSPQAPRGQCFCICAIALPLSPPPPCDPFSSANSFLAQWELFSHSGCDTVYTPVSSLHPRHWGQNPVLLVSVSVSNPGAQCTQSGQSLNVCRMKELMNKEWMNSKNRSRARFKIFI